MDAGDGSRFDVERDVTREQIAVMLWRYAGKPAGPGRAPLFPDFSDVSSWAREAVAWAADRGILRGTDGGRLDPGGKTTRAEAASMLVRFLEDSVRFYRCQFVISTHSPFLLAMRGAKIYDLDSVPVQTCRWTDLEHIQTYWKFFQEHQESFKDQETAP